MPTQVNDSAVDVKVTLGFRAHFDSPQQLQLPATGRQLSNHLTGPWVELSNSGIQHHGLSPGQGVASSGPVITEHQGGAEDDMPSVRPSSVQCPPDTADKVEGGACKQDGECMEQLQPASADAVTVAVCDTQGAVSGSPFAALRHQPWSLSADKLSRSAGHASQAQQQQQPTAQQQLGTDIAMADDDGRPVPCETTDVTLGQACGQLVAATPTLSHSHWQLDAARLTLGRRIAVGGFAEVFVGRYEGTVVAVKRLYTTDQGAHVQNSTFRLSMMESRTGLGSQQALGAMLVTARC